MFKIVNCQIGIPTIIDKNITLSSRAIYSVFCDSKNQIWISTSKGLNLYNSKTVKNFNTINGLPENEVFYVFEDSKNRIWIWTLKDEWFFIKNNKIETKNNNKQLLEFNKKTFKYKSNITTKMYQDKDTIYFVSYQNIYKFIDTSSILNIYTSKEEFYYLDVFKINKTIYSFTTKGICELNSGKLITPFVIDNYKTTKFIEYNGINYFLYKNTIYKIDNFKIVPIYMHKKENVIINFSFMDNKEIVFNTPTEIFSYNIKNKLLQTIYQNKEIHLTNILVDKEKNIWIGTRNNELLLFSNLQYHFLFPEIKNITQILSYKDLLFIGDNNGDAYKTNLNTNYAEKIHMPNYDSTEGRSNYIRAIAIEDSLNLWVGTSNRLCKYNLQTKISNTISIALKNIETDANHKTWATAMGGVYKTSELEGKKKTLFYIQDSTLYGFRYYGFCHDSIQNHYYISHDNIFITYKENIKKVDTLNSRIVKIKTKNHQLFWIINQDNGFVLYDRKKFYKIEPLNLNKEKILCIDFYLINDSTAWIAYDGGYSKIEINTTTKQLKKTEAYTLNGNNTQININTIVFNNGSICLGTDRGLIAIKESDLKKESYDVPIMITNININGESVEIKNNYKLKSNQTNINVEFVGLYYQNLGDVTYRYQFIGNDTTWHFTKTNRLEFPNLNGGNYLIRINCCDKYGNWSKNYVSVSFEIAIPFYSTIWFKMLLVAFLTISMYYFINKQIVKKNQKELDIKNKLLESEKNILELDKQKTEAEQKMFMAQLNPHFIFNAINSMQAYILSNKTLEAYDYLQKFSSFIRNVLINSKNMLVSIEDELENIKLYLEIESLRFNGKLSFTITHDENINSKDKIPSMLLQPHIENAIWHGIMPKKEGGIITVHFGLSQNYLIATIADNGIGREASSKISSIKKGTGTGISLTENRLKLYSNSIGKKYKIEVNDIIKNDIVEGTCIILTIPLSEKN